MEVLTLLARHVTHLFHTCSIIILVIIFAPQAMDIQTIRQHVYGAVYIALLAMTLQITAAPATLQALTLLFFTSTIRRDISIA